jgi:hypothetical protein
MCGQNDIALATDDEGSATRKPTHPVEGSRDVSDVLTLTDVPTRPSLCEAIGAPNPGVAILGDGMSCPTVASSQDVRPVVSTADATLLVNTGDGLNQLELSQETGVAKPLPQLILSSNYGTTLVDRSKFVKDTGLSIEDNQFLIDLLLGGSLGLENLPGKHQTDVEIVNLVLFLSIPDRELVKDIFQVLQMSFFCNSALQKDMIGVAIAELPSSPEEKFEVSRAFSLESLSC